ncbi:MAG: hypothetical protein U0U69_08920 [Acidimicrobiia bacterium]
MQQSNHVPSRRAAWTRIVAMSSVAALASVVLIGIDARSGSAVNAYASESSGLDGGGFQNAVAVDPFGTGTVLSGGDVSGLSLSTNSGDTWRPVNSAMVNTSQMQVATIVFSRRFPGTVYAGTGSRGIGGGLFVSKDSGRTWHVLTLG